MTAVLTATNLRPSEAADLAVAPLLEPTGPATVRGWHDDPMGLHALRFHDGLEWTEHVTHLGPVPCRGGCRPRP